MSHVCDEPVAHEIQGAELLVPPEPLLRNMGRAASGTYFIDVMVRELNLILGDKTKLDNCYYLDAPKMMSFFNGKERTITFLRDLLKEMEAHCCIL